MDAFAGLLQHYGVSALGWILFAAVLAGFIFGKFKLTAVFNDRLAEMEARVKDRDQRIEDEREDKNSWQQAYLTLMQAREQDQHALQDAIAGMRTVTTVVTKLRQTLARMTPPGGSNDVAS